MTDFTNFPIYEGYKDLLTITNGGNGLSNVLTSIQDGRGVNSPLELATDKFNINRTIGQFQLDGIAITASAQSFDFLNLIAPTTDPSTIGIGSNTFSQALNSIGSLALGQNAASAQSLYNNCIFIGNDADSNTNNIQNAVAIGVSSKVDVNNGFILGGNTTLVGIRNSSPPRALSLSGGAAFNLKRVIANDTLTADDFIVFVDTSTIAITITLPTALNYFDLSQPYIIKDVTGNAAINNITIVGPIDGQPNYVINTNYGIVRLCSNAFPAGYHVI